MITNFKIFEESNFTQLNEACDEIYPNGKSIPWDDENTVAFIVYSGNYNEPLIIDFSNNQEMHINIFRHTENRQLYQGRLFLDSKIITFWEYPTKTHFFEILDIIHEKLEWNSINISKNFDSDWNNWKIEVVDPDSMDYYNDNDFYLPEIYKYIPVKYYNGSINPPDKVYQNHLDLKKNKKVLGKYGSKKEVKYKIPGELPIETKRRLKNIYQENILNEKKSW